MKHPIQQPGLFRLTVLIALAYAALLACGPADQTVQESLGNRALTEASPRDSRTNLPLAEAPQGVRQDSDGQEGDSTLTQRPTQTPYPPDYVKPTDLPTYTPFPTVPPPPTPDPNEPRSVEDVPTTPSATELVTQFTRENAGLVDAAARIRILSRRTVRIPTDIEWPENGVPYIEDENGEPIPHIRTKFEVVDAFYGTVPADYELFTFASWPNSPPEVDREYIFLLRFQVGGEDDFPDDPSKTHYNEAQLEAFGGKGAHVWGEQTWIIEEDTAWRVPGEYLRDKTLRGFALPGAKVAGESLTVADLVAAIKAGFN